jgi:hypothetical protein
MPELVACPACGCRVQMMDGTLGKRIRCLACGQTFVAGALPAPAAEPETVTVPLPRLEPTEGAASPPRPATGQRSPWPLCPSCSRPVPWEANDCPHCGLFLEADASVERWSGFRRRDQEPHRSRLVGTLGQISLLAGGLSLCLPVLGQLVSLGTGIPAWVMANHDLEMMRTGLIDPDGRVETENGKIAAIVGVCLSLGFAAFIALFAWAKRL